MVKRSSLRVRFQEMVQDMQQGQHMLLVAAELGLPNILDNHVTDSFAAMVAGQKVLSERCRSDFGEVFVLCDGEHLLFRQAAEPNAVFKRDHVRPGGTIRAPRRCVIGSGPVPRLDAAISRDSSNAT
jgi:hypothetical protein